MPGKKYRSIQNPKQYEAIKKKELAMGKSLAQAKTSAARISNARTPGHKVKKKTTKRKGK